MKTKWWGWGTPGVRFSLNERPGIKQYLNEKLKFSNDFQEKRFLLQDVKLPKSKLVPSQIDRFSAILEEARVCSDNASRIFHSTGKSYKDLLHLRSLELKFAPDLVVFPISEKEVAAVIALCTELDLSIIPFGGGTSVVGGVDAITEKSHPRPVITMNLTKMNHLISLDKKSMTAEFEAGILGPELEAKLQEQGFTLGHFPQSFEFSTLGGWIAARSSGQNSILYGGIEKLVSSLEIVSASGKISTLKAPRHAVGPDLKEVLLGSEGTLGIITRAIVRVRKLPEEKHYFLLGFQNFESACEAVRRIVQAGLQPAMLRISDEQETEAMYRFGHKANSKFGELSHEFGNWYLSTRGFTPPHLSALMIGIEDCRSRVNSIKSEILNCIRDLKFLNLGTTPGQKWLKDRFFLPYLRDELMDNNIFLETLETATSWTGLNNLHKKVREGIEEEFKKDRLQAVVFAHVSHAYRDGASLYFTVLGQQAEDPGQKIEQWMRIKARANQIILAHNGVISHHHGIGIDHRQHTNWDADSRQVLASIKKTLDPNGIFNPGKLL